MTPLTIATCRARALACEECANHLDLNWTEDTTEVLAGRWLAARMREEATRWRERAHELAVEPNQEQVQPECKAKRSPLDAKSCVSPSMECSDLTAEAQG